MSHWFGKIWIRIWDSSVVLPFTFGSFEESCLFVSWCAADRCDMICSDENRDRNKRLGAKDRGWSHRSDTLWPGDRDVGWRCVRSAPCTWRLGAWVSWLSLKIKVDDFLRFGLKTSGNGLPGLGRKTVSSGLVIWAATVSWFGPQNQAGFGLSVAPQNWRRKYGTRHASRFDVLLRLEASHARVSQSCLKTGGGATADGARGTIVEVALRSSWKRVSRCDGWRRTLLPLLYRFICIRH
jgi:hypothetical protein